MPKLPVNMVKRKGRSGFHFRKKVAGKTTWVALGKDYEEACLELRKLKREGEKVLVRLTVGDALRQWLERYVPIARQPAGQKLAEFRIERYLEPFFGQMLLSRVTRNDLREFRQYLETQDIQPRTVVHVLSDARCFFNWCEDAGLIDRSPFPRRIMPRVQEEPPDRLTDKEAEMLRRLSDPHGFVCRLALGTGLRWGELCRAQASDVERGFLIVHQTKSGKVRRVPLEPELLAEVRQHVGRLVPYARVSPGSFARGVHRATGIAGFHVHQMRHTFACQYLERGGTLHALQQILGHASVVTTQRYAKLTDEMVMSEMLGLRGQGVAKGVAIKS